MRVVASAPCMPAQLSSPLAAGSVAPASSSGSHICGGSTETSGSTLKHPSPLKGFTQQIFLLVNPKSGGKEGRKLIQVQQPLELRLTDGSFIGQAFSVRIVDITDREACAKGYVELKAATQKYTVRVIIGGGDGTIMSVLERLMDLGIRIDKDLRVGIIALGTGNDFSRAAGWGGSAPSKMMRQAKRRNYTLLTRFVQQWMEARPRPHDVWKVSLVVDSDTGCIHEGGKPIKGSQVCRSMINYFSVGQDALVGLGVEQNRTEYRCMNLVCYVMFGALRMLPCGTRHRIGNIISGLYEGAGAEENASTIFETTGDASQPQLSRSCFGHHAQSLVVLNIPSYGGGTASRLWDGANRLGVDKPLDPHLDEAQNDPGDGKLDVVSVQNLITLSQDWASTSLSGFGGRRIYSGSPLFLEFQEDIVAHCNIDGEYYEVENPVSVTIEPTLNANGESLRLQVLHRNEAHNNLDAGCDSDSESVLSSSEYDESEDDSCDDGENARTLRSH